MKISQRVAAILLLALLVSPPALGQGTGAQMQRFSSGGVSFQYPVQWKLTDKSNDTSQHLVLELNGTSAQIMVLVERTPSTQPGQRTATLQARSNAFADIMTKELEKTGTTVQRSDVTTDVGGVAADGLRLRAAPGNQPGSIEVYSFVLSGRIVMLTLLRPDRDAQAAAPAWAAVRSSLRVGASAQSTAQRDLRLVDEREVTTVRPSNDSPTSTSASNKFAGVDFGSVTGYSYANNFFGFRLTIPYGWRVQGKEVKDLLTEKGRETIKTGDAQRNSQIDKSFDNTVNLLTVFKYDVGAARDFNASVICGAEWLPRSMSANQYLLNAKNVLESSSQGKFLYKPFATETVGGEGFAVMEVETASLTQKYYVSIKKGYALFFILTYASDEDEAVLRQVMRSVRFS
ncbi:MAG TPA: hypothetical protein VEQ40_12930 [Pyrinomonadaceae bacterium]|nr:hypothetical protein [Pyrinomonadaceae bacterium]